MSNRRFILIICIVIVLSALIFQVSEDQRTKGAQVIEPLLRGQETQVFEPPLLKEEEVPLEKVVTPKPAPVKKDLNKITSEAFLVGNLDSGEIYLNYNSNKIFPIASLSKLFTAIIAIHNLDKDKKITITESMLEAFGDAGHLAVGENYTVDELLYPLLLESSNDAADALASSFGYQEFISLMNGFAKEIGLQNTSFRDASGLSSMNISNAGDLFLLARYIYHNESDLLSKTRLSEMTLATTSERNFHHYISINPFTPYEPFIGGKTGRTKEAKESMVSLFNYRTHNSTTTIPVAIIILRSEFGEREMDTERILDRLDKRLQATISDIIN